MPTIVNSLLVPTAPNLPLAPKTYEPRYHDNVNNVLRLYFNLLGGNDITSLLGPLGGQHLNIPFGSFQDNSNQYDGSTSIPYAFRFNTTDFGNGVSVQSRSVLATASIAATTMTVTGIITGRFYPGMLLSGTGVTAGSYVYLQLSSTATPVAGTFSFVSGGAAGATTVVLSSVAGLEARQFISGTGVPANTRVVAVDPNTKTVTLSAAFTVQAAGNYTFRPWGYQGTYSVSPSQTVASTAISGTSASMITVAQPGIYNVQFSAQFTNTDTQLHDVDVWFKKNDVDLPNSNSQFSVPSSHGGVDGHLIAGLNYIVEMQANDAVEIVWHTNNSAVYVQTIPAQTSPIRPLTPSIIATVTFVSTLTTP